VKLALVMLMVALAIANRVVLAPQLAAEGAHPGALRALRYSVAAKQAMGLAVLAIVALLGTIDPGQ
jgi:putative copper resistance protein D